MPARPTSRYTVDRPSPSCFAAAVGDRDRASERDGVLTQEKLSIPINDLPAGWFESGPASEDAAKNVAKVGRFRMRLLRTLCH